MSDRAKKIIFTIVFAAVAILLGLGIWYFFFKPLVTPEVPPAPEVPVTPTPTGLPPAAPSAPRVPVAPGAPGAPAPSTTAQGGLTQTSLLSSTPVLAPFLSADGTTLQFYNRVDGKFYRIKPDGTLELLSDRVFFNVSNVTWAGDTNQAILEYPDGSNIVYNFETEKQVTLPRHWQQFSFSPRSDGIAFLSLGTDEDARWLATSAPDGSQTKPIEPLGANASKVQVAWSPNEKVIAFSKTGQPQGVNEQEILLVGQNKENFKSLVVNGLGFRGTWSPDGTRLLYSATSSADGFRPQLWITDGTPDRIGQGKTSFGLNTWADKCTFGTNTTIYCAVPQNLPEGAGLYPAAAQNLPDQLWKVNLTTGERTRIAIPTEDHTIGNIVISKDERYLYFTDQASGQLYKIDLK